MNLLAIELSTSQGSLALFQNRELADQLDWDTAPRHNQILFDSLHELVQRNDLGFADLDVIAVGRGPGNYSGLRMSITAAQGLVLPGDVRLHVVSSCHALAVASDASQVAVVGDARRGLCWLGLITDGAMTLDWQLAPFDQLSTLIPEGAQLLSPDAQRIANAYPAQETFGSRWPEEDVLPTAQHVGQLALQQISQGVESQDPVPLYVQPAV